jgi:DNA-binding transcriptional regulator LsrR (DeoR family)/transcriptional regulator with XRE-family HTH domain
MADQHFDPDDPEDKKTLKEQFAENLKRCMKGKHLTVKDLAEKLKCQEQMVKRWLQTEELKSWYFPSLPRLVQICNTLECSADHLLEIRLPGECRKMVDGWEWRWFERIPDHLPPVQVEEYRLGVSFFRNSLNLDPDFPVSDRLPVELNRAFRVAVLSGALQLVEVPRDTEREAKIVECYAPYGLSEENVIVAALPQRAGKWLGHNAIRTELIAFLAAQYPLGVEANLHGTTIGTGPGYTVLRCMELTSASTRQFSGTKFVPLMTVDDPDVDHVTTSSNYSAAFMASRHPNAIALRLPFIPPGRRQPIVFADPKDLTDEERVAAKAMRATSQLDAMFMSVGGVSPAGYGDTPSLEKQDNFFSLETLQRIHDVLRHKYPEYVDKFACEVLGLFVDENGQPLGPPEFQEYNLGKVCTMRLEVLKNLVSGGIKVWIVGAGPHKKKPTLVAIKNGLANALVIDSEIAQFLIEQA